MALDLFTCSYTEMRPEMGVPVRFTVGAPRFRLRYDLEHVFRGGTPTRQMLRLPKPQYREAYIGLLESRGIGAIVDELLGIARQANDHRLVLLCFENLGKEGLWCHRTMFGEWWEALTGDPVRELGAHGPAVKMTPEDHGQGRLL